ncbi:hypothetical protein NL676_029933 [Syzygium grande]|nr:hypothetical protein NL676_029933 [Syzygium grande]
MCATAVPTLPTSAVDPRRGQLMHIVTELEHKSGRRVKAELKPILEVEFTSGFEVDSQIWESPLNCSGSNPLGQVPPLFSSFMKLFSSVDLSWSLPLE